jgi:hypothetical protein
MVTREKKIKDFLFFFFFFAACSYLSLWFSMLFFSFLRQEHDKIIRFKRDKDIRSNVQSLMTITKSMYFTYK